MCVCVCVCVRACVRVYIYTCMHTRGEYMYIIYTLLILSVYIHILQYIYTHGQERKKKQGGRIG